MGDNLRKLMTVVMAGLVVMSSAGCADKVAEKSTEKLIERGIEQGIEDGGGKADVDVDDGKMSITNEDGTTTFGGKDLPAWLPDGFPILDGEVVSVIDSPEGALVTIAVEGDVLAAFDGAVADLEAFGLETETVSDLGEGRIASFGAGEGTVAVTLSAIGDQEITYLLTKA